MSNPKRLTPRHIIIKMPKVEYKERILKATREKQLVPYTMQDRRTWHRIFKVLKTQDLKSRIVFPSKLSFRVEGQRKNFLDKE